MLYGVPANLSLDDVLLARGLAAWGDAFLTGGLTAIFVAFRPGGWPPIPTASTCPMTDRDPETIYLRQNAG